MSDALQLAREAAQCGQWQTARDRYAEALREDAGNFDGWMEAAHVCQHHGTRDQVLTCFKRAVDISPQRWLGHASLAAALEATGNPTSAAVHYWRAQQCEDGAQGFHAHRLVGRARIARGELAGAAEALAHALKCAPSDGDAQVDMADVLMRLGDDADARILFIEAGRSRQRPQLERLAEVLFRHNLWQQAESVFRGLREEYPRDWKTHFNLAKLLIESWRMQEGLEVLAEAERQAGGALAGAASLRAAAAGKLGDTHACTQNFAAIARGEPHEAESRSAAAIATLYNDSMSAKQAALTHRELFEALGEGARTLFANTPDPTRPLRIGYVTADLHHQHPVNLFLQPVLAKHDAAQFHSTAYFTGVTNDLQTLQARTRCEQWREVARLDDRRLAKMIEADGIDILIDLMGHTAHNRRVLFARRAAPVQVSFLGYPSSTGLPNMDWIVADGQIAPEGQESLFSERVARLPNCVFCFSPEDDYAYPEYGPEHAKRPLTFGSFNNVAKLTPSTVALWARVLAELPKSRLVLKAPSFMDPGARERFVRLFAAEGIDAARIECREPAGLTNMMAEYADIDIALDTWPYNGGTTTCQALWMGVPVVSLAGEGFWQRMGASILNSIGRPQWVAGTPEEFIKIAKQLAGKRVNLLAEKKGLRARMQQSAAMDIDRYVRDLEALYRHVWRDWCGRH